MFCLYSNLWEECALKEFLNKTRGQIIRRGRGFIFGSGGIAAYNWSTNRITDAEMQNHMDEFKYVCILKQAAVTCHCAKSEKETFQNWTLFLEKQDILVWRKLHESGNYEYKVYGSYNDVSAIDFLNVQIDTKYRRTWDNTAVTLEVVDTDPDLSSNTDVVYWEMLWPVSSVFYC